MELETNNRPQILSGIIVLASPLGSYPRWREREKEDQAEEVKSCVFNNVLLNFGQT